MPQDTVEAIYAGMKNGAFKSIEMGVTPPTPDGQFVLAYDLNPDLGFGAEVATGPAH